MKHVALSLLTAACCAFNASALDASKARIWLSEKIKPEFIATGASTASEKLGKAPAFARGWQYVSIPVHVEGVATGKYAPHYIPELKVRISLAVIAEDIEDSNEKKLELLSKEITYVDIPLVKGKTGNVNGSPVSKGESIVNMGVYISPSNAFKLAPKDGSLAKKLVAVAVEGEFKGSSCNHVKEGPNDDVATGVKLDKTTPISKKLPEGSWWKKTANSDIAIVSIAETPFAADYASKGFPAIKTLYGAPVVAPVAAPAVAATPVEGPVGGPVSSEGSSYSDDSATSTEGDSASTESDTSSSKKSRKNRRSRR